MNPNGIHVFFMFNMFFCQCLGYHYSSITKYGEHGMEEFSLIRALKQSYYTNSSLIRGVGDDAAVFRQSSEDIVTAVDTFVENIHFSRKTMSSFDIGYRSLAANISDMAAMGALPAFYLTSIVVPKTWLEHEILDIFNGMKSLASDYGMDLIGGDTVSGTELMISITIIGFVEKGKARYRHLAQPDDVVFVTGTVGDSQAGLHILTHENTYENEAYFIQRHRQPLPRVQFSRELLPIQRLALNDVSDGIANEAAEIAELSSVNMTLIADQIPISDAFHQFPKKLQHEWTYFGGEDFELLGTVSTADWPKVLHAASDARIKVTKIGYVTQSDQEYGKVYLQDNNQTTQIMKHGYTHLK